MSSHIFMSFPTSVAIVIEPILSSFSLLLSLLPSSSSLSSLMSALSSSSSLSLMSTLSSSSSWLSLSSVLHCHRRWQHHHDHHNSIIALISCDRNKRESRSYLEIYQSVGVDKPSQILFLTDVYQEAVAAKTAGIVSVF